MGSGGGGGVEEGVGGGVLEGGGGRVDGGAGGGADGGVDGGVGGWSEAVPIAPLRGLAEAQRAYERRSSGAAAAGDAHFRCAVAYGGGGVAAVLSAVAVVRNLLPCPALVELRAGPYAAPLFARLCEGAQLPVHLPPAFNLVVALEGLAPCAPFVPPEAGAARDLVLGEGLGPGLTLRCSARQAAAGAGPLEVDIWAPLWATDASGLGLLLAPEDGAAVPVGAAPGDPTPTPPHPHPHPHPHPPGGVRLSASAADRAALLSGCGVRGRGPTPIGAEAVSRVGVLGPDGGVRWSAGAPLAERGRSLVEVPLGAGVACVAAFAEGAAGAFGRHGTKVLSLAPRFAVANRTGLPLRVAQALGGGRTAAAVLDPDARRGVAALGGGLGGLLFALPGTGWSLGGVAPDKVSATALHLPPQAPPAAPLEAVLHVEVRFGPGGAGAETECVVWCPRPPQRPWAEGDPPPPPPRPAAAAPPPLYAVLNETHLAIALRQAPGGARGAPAVPAPAAWTVGPHSGRAVGLSLPGGPRALEVLWPGQAPLALPPLDVLGAGASDLMLGPHPLRCRVCSHGGTLLLRLRPGSSAEDRGPRRSLRSRLLGRKGRHRRLLEQRRARGAAGGADLKLDLPGVVLSLVGPGGRGGAARRCASRSGASGRG